jgi:hypothetical protein
MRYKYTLFFIAIIFSLTSELKAQKSTSSDDDALIIYKTVNNFFEWYIDAIKQKKSEYKPIFVEGKNGMTTLDFTEYFANLTKYGLSDSLIIKEKMSYQRCVANLENIKYSDLKTKFILGDFEEIGCDFGNSFRWTGGQEPIDGIRINSLQFNDSNSTTVSIDQYYDTKEARYYSWRSYAVVLIKIKDNWKIDSIECKQQ